MCVTKIKLCNSLLTHLCPHIATIFVLSRLAFGLHLWHGAGPFCCCNGLYRLSCFSVGGINGIWPFKSVVGTLQLLNRVPEQTAQS